MFADHAIRKNHGLYAVKTKRRDSHCMVWECIFPYEDLMKSLISNHLVFLMKRTYIMCE
jgi:hypothetical protein